MGSIIGIVATTVVIATVVAAMFVLFLWRIANPRLETAQDATERLLWIVRPKSHWPMFRDERKAFRSLLDREVQEYPDDPIDWMGMVSEATGQELSFIVDWKDSESFVGFVEKLAAAYKAKVDWRTADVADPDALLATSIQDLMPVAYASLLEQKITLWNWNTDCDSYGVFLAHSYWDDDIPKISRLLGTDIRQGEYPF